MTRLQTVGIILLLAAGGYYVMSQFTPAWLVALGEGIAQAEGFGIPGALPTRYNNPGDVTDGSGNKIQFMSVADGFSALYKNVMGAFDGTSTYYTPTMTLQQFAETWTGGDQADSWITTVLAVFNSARGTSLSPDNTLQDVSNS